MITIPDTSHLDPYHAELFRALYLERWGCSRGELARVRLAAERARTRDRKSSRLSAGGDLLRPQSFLS